MAGPTEIVVANRQRARRLDRRLALELARWAANELKVESVQLGFHFVTANEMARVHQQFMGIRGSTDVITFDHGSQPPDSIHGEVFISVEDAVAHAREFKTTWQDEVARYVIHGILHLLGHDDLEPRVRARMKREENRLLKKAASRFDLRALEKT